MRASTWRWGLLIGGVVALHLVLLNWGVPSSDVQGDEAWRVASPSSVRPIRAIVLHTDPQRTLHTEAPARPPVAERSDRSAGDDPADADQATAEPALDRQREGHRHWGPPSPAHYLSVEQVDQYPHPQQDWVLHPASIPIQVSNWRVTLQIWVSADGRIDHVEKLEARPDEPWMDAYLAPLRQTTMVPAQLAGQAVPVTMVVQLAPDQLQ
ncbi:MAG: hypothetical protein KGI52_00875 [Burkholderiales bacterium]|nr:hypothetical protein [Burkholderiales bacterium]